MEIALYGKGGIGKSTIASNLSVCMSSRGHKTLQIGCDPKHDSTLLLLKQTLNTVLETIIHKANYSRNDLFQHGNYGIDCVEIGGPSPGVGCAGRGIIKGLEVLDEFNIIDKEIYDLTVFDVLGDVVCGGFFEPIKHKRVKEIYIVTSGEFNALFAANNICLGYLNCKLQEKGIKLAGIIGNYRGIPNEEKIVRNFCDKVNLNLIAEIHRDNMIEECTAEGIPFVIKYPESDSSKKIQKICDFIEQTDKMMKIPNPVPLSILREIFLNAK